MILSVSQPGSETVERPGCGARATLPPVQYLPWPLFCPAGRAGLGLKAALEQRRLEEPGNALPFSAARLPWGPSPAALWDPPRSEHSQRAAMEALGFTTQKQYLPAEDTGIARLISIKDHCDVQLQENPCPHSKF